MYTSTKLQNIKMHKDKVRFKLDFERNGKRYRKVITTSTDIPLANRLIIAQLELEIYRTKIDKESLIIADTTATVDIYWNKVKLLKNWTTKVSNDYQSYYDKYLSKLANIRILDLKSSHFTNLNIKLKDMSPRYRKKAYEILRPIIELAIEDELIKYSPIKRSHIPKRNSLQEKKVVLNAVDKYRIVHSAIHKLFKDNPHHRAMFLFGLHGRRLGEVTSLEWSDINFSDNTYVIRKDNSKVKQDMVFKLPRELIETLKELYPCHGMVFSVKELRKHYRHIRTETGIEEFTFHWMRNLLVSTMASKGASSTDMSAVLGHTDVNTVKKYLSLQREDSSSRTNELLDNL